MLNNNYNTTSTDVNSAETKALRLLQKLGYEAIQSPDWLAKKDGRWICVEAKGKELFEPGPNFPHPGIGLNKSQLYLRKQLLEDFGLRTILINFDPDTGEVYWQYLDVLEQGKCFDTPKQDIRIYPLKNFNAITARTTIDKGGG